MGDTGSLALGGALVAMAILTKTELLTCCNWWHFCYGSIVRYYSSYIF